MQQLHVKNQMRGRNVLSAESLPHILYTLQEAKETQSIIAESQQVGSAKWRDVSLDVDIQLALNKELKIQEPKFLMNPVRFSFFSFIGSSLCLQAHRNEGVVWSQRHRWFHTKLISAPSPNSGNACSLLL